MASKKDYKAMQANKQSVMYSANKTNSINTNYFMHKYLSILLNYTQKQ